MEKFLVKDKRKMEEMLEEINTTYDLKLYHIVPDYVGGNKCLLWK